MYKGTVDLLRLAWRSEEVSEVVYGTNGRGRDWRSIVLAILVALVLVLGSTVVYEQSQISNLSALVSSQSEELSRPSSQLQVLNYTVTKANESAAPTIFFAVFNTGQTPIAGLSMFALVYGQGGNAFQQCYNDTLHEPAIVHNESVTFMRPLTCGNVGESVVLTVTATFLSASGTGSKVVSLFTKIISGTTIEPQFFVVDHLRVKTWIYPFIWNGSTSYGWQITIINDGQEPIVGMRAVLSPRGGPPTEESAFIVGTSGGNFLGRSYPLSPGATCTGGTSVHLSPGSLYTGQTVPFSITVTYANSTTSVVSGSAVVV